ncbi:hypothetical protein HN51_046745 [Arachis hypogaea]|uniref:AAA+ ATPase domain-containing protein n=2 Tax=Arachis TaxID=3817 RepID=A0A445ADZ2_ARAHY|nr:uncharacterized protein LOC112726852 [Arachis hypogaea]XP_025632179.1 uncharacterized protein LOC112726852 [Arachis hypogaea]XP_025632181.1 uncharacterized protein LOC112726852 [Arachis hypogaea]XP_029146410.1 uncharacterized protein LOC112726852 [Arachis hypogaea]RYR24636.1 hypothetical protein Ahy_B02g058146 [Arachis hypogaea]
MAIPIPIPEFLQEYTVNLVAEYVTNHLDYVWNYEKKFDDLSRVVKELQEERDRVHDKAEEEEDRYGREIYNDVKVWLDRIDEVISEYEKFKEEHRKNGEYPLSLSNLETRHRRSKTAQDIEEKIRELQQEKHDSISHCQGASSMGFAFANVDYEAFDSRKEITRNITRALEDSRARAIGIHGPAGVGKTTLVIEVANKAWKDKLFNVVIMVNVTKSPDIRKIQGQIAEMLGMKLEEESEHVRALRIQKRLKKEKENALIILDDMSVKVDLDMLGLGIASETYSDDIDCQKNLIVPEGRKSSAADNFPPSKNKTKQSPKDGSAEEIEKTSVGSGKLKTEERHKGCKVLLISEMRQVLSQMGVKPSLIFSVNVLSDKEAETLFKKRAGIVDKNFELGKIAAEITKKCHGLPMSIVTTAKALKNQSPSVWEDTRLKLHRQSLTGTPEYSTRLSYNLLENEELKLTFLLCASMGHDALIADLVKRCIGLGFLQDIYTVREARDRVQSLLVKLKQSGLLSDSYSSDHFSMQNLVRNAALSIASADNHVFRLTKGKLDEWPDEDKLEKYTDIFLQHCDFIEEFPRRIRCPRVRVFHIDNNDPHLKIPDNFFQEMKELRVLILTGIHLLPLPSSIGYLTKLRMLCLEHCKIDEKSLCIIGELKNLRILSFSGSEIESLPVELKNLSKLQIFDISNCTKLGGIPPKVISSMTRLEELYMRNTSIQWKINEEQENQSEIASLSELGHLNQLSNLDLQIPSAAHLPKNLFFDRLQNYKIIVGSSERYSKQEFKMPEKYELVRFLAIQQKYGFDIHSQNEIKMLFERVENLLLEKFNGVQDLFYELNLKGFPCLKELFIVSNSDICSLINPKDRKRPEMAFPKLELLDLYKLKNMKEICSSSCELSKPSFGKLKIIKIMLCSALKNVFQISLVGFLTALETIEVSECSSLKEIVHVENTSQIGTLGFPELRHLSLRSLVEFVGFDPILLEDSRILFHGRVGVTKLERLELSAIQIDCIWNDGQSSHFGNLIHLDVNNCGNLKYLLSLSVAKGLVNLQSLFISECEQMRCIFNQEQCRDSSKKDSIFPKLKNIKLSSMKRLSEIWSFGVRKDSFGKLDTLIIEKCDKLVNVFPSYLVGIFRSLSSLRVTSCNSMEAIFDLAFKNKYAKYVSRLQEVHLETLPKLEHVLRWRENQEGIFYFNHLQKMYVQDCENLENMFPVFVAENLENLEYLVVLDCIRLREIVAKGEEEDIKRGREFKLPKLTTLNFSKLPKFKSFYPGVNGLSCPLLNELSIELCDNLELFTEEKVDASSGKERILFPEEVINNLKSMQIEWQHAKSSTRYRRDNLEELRLSRLKKTEVIYSFLHSNPNLKSLWLNDCSFKVLMPLEKPANFESLGVVPKLKSLKLTNLSRLEKIGFEQDAILQRIEFLILKNCHGLSTIALSSVSLAYLTNLEVVDCQGLKYLMSLPTARSLSQLNVMKVIDCKSLTEIVSEQGKEEENALCEVNILFKQLKTLELVSLKSLESFCNSESCVFEFPSLEKLVVSACPKMESFCREVKSTPILQKIYVVHDKEKKRWCWNGHLQATIQDMFKNKKYFEGMDEISVHEHPYLQEVWQGGKNDLQKDWFYNLESLTLSGIEFELYAIPSNVLCCLKRLKELTVRDCDKIKSIFEMNDTVFRGTFQLKKLYLDWLPNMTHVWEMDNQGISCFQNLQEVIVESCDKLETLFPTALARDLRMLEQLDVSFCDELLEIVGREDGEKEKKEAEEGTTGKSLFPRLTKLKLNILPQLTCFCSTTFTLGCPELHVLDVIGCNKLQLFQGQLKAEDSTSITIHPTFSSIQVISEVEHLCLNWKDTSVLCSLLSQVADDEKLQYLNVLELYLDDDVNEKSTLPLQLLEKTPNLEKLEIYYCIIQEIFSQLDTPKIINSNGTLGNLKQLHLFDLSELSSISGLEHLPKLQLLYVSECPSLTSLVVQSGSNLNELKISRCHRLACLFTSRTARMLKNLKEMCIYSCESMKEIVGEDEQDEIQENQEIKFERLERIRLEDLESLDCFYPGNATLQLPSLIQVEILECPKVKIFSRGPINAESFRGIRYSYYQDDDLVFHSDLNSSIGRLFLYQGHLALGDFPQLEEIWLGAQEIPSDFSFSKLKSLKVEGCEFLSDAVLSSHLFPLLENLEELCVQKCDRVKAIFDLKDTSTRDPNMIVTLGLKTLILKQLPTLRHVWNKDPEGYLSLPSLCKVIVDECKSIKTLLPSSNTEKEEPCAILPSHLLSFLSKLEELQVRKCDSVGAIFDMIDAPKHDADMIIIPLRTLILERLPNLSHVWNSDPKGSLSLALEKVTVNECKSIKSLFPASVAKDNIQKLDVRCCAELVEIVANNEATIKEANKEVTIFTKLTSLTLCDLPNLKSICSEMQIIDSSKLDGCEKSSSSAILPSYLLPCLSKLEELQVQKCDSVEAIFDVIDAPTHDANMIVIPLKTLILEQLPNLSHVWNKDPKGSLSLSLEKVTVNECKSIKSLFPASVAKDNIQRLDVRSCVKLVEIVANNEAAKEEANKEVTLLTKLTSLTLCDLPNLKSICSEMQIIDSSDVDGCEKLSSSAILPSYLLPCLSKLEELQVQKCDSVEAIFDVIDAPTHDSNMIITIPLKRMTLEHLPTMRHVWNKDPQGSISLALEAVTINECKSIKSLFPASVAKDNLQKLEVRNCVELVEIVARDEAATKEASKELAMFPKLTLLVLCDLPNLGCICSGMQILDWPLLEKLNVYHCENLKVLAANSPNSPRSYPEDQDTITIESHGILSTGSVALQLVKLSLNKEDIIMIEQELPHVDLQKIKTLTLQSFNDDSDTFPNDFFTKVPLPNIKKLRLIDSAFEALFHSQRPELEQHTKILSQLKKLELKNLYKLKSIGLEHSWVAPLLENLKVLKVLECSCLTNLVPSTVQSFSCLTELHVEGCARLQYLFTSSTAKRLVALDEISVSNCELLETVVAHEESDKPDDQVIFPELWNLSLSKLPRLGSFYTGNSTLKFRWLMNVTITECKCMETFSRGNLVVAHKLRNVDIDEEHLSKVDLNTVIQQQFEKKERKQP